MVPVRETYISPGRYAIKSPYPMEPECIVMHNTANDATARNELAYMQRNSNEASFHVVIDDVEILKCIPFNRMAWHAGDGKNGKGNRKGISVEICFSKSGGSRFIKAEKNAAEYVAMLLKQYGWGIDKVTKHQDYSGKYCPHRTLDMGWQRFLDMVAGYMKADEQKAEGGASDQLYRVQVGAYKELTNATVTAAKLKAAGFSTYIIKVDGLHKVQVGAYKEKANAEATAEKVKAAGFSTYITTNASGTPISTSTAAKKVLKVGSKVKVKEGAKDYDKGLQLSSFVYKNTYKVIQIKGERVVIGKSDDDIIAAIDKDNLIMV